MATLYGVLVDDHTDPYVTGYDRLDMWALVLANRKTRTARLVVEVHDCEYCGDGLPGGWVEVDENGDFIEPPMHDLCYGFYAEERWIDV